MNLKRSLIIFTFIVPLLGHPYLSYKSDIQEHKQEFLHWIANRGLWDAYARIILTLSCNDADEIPKCPDAGKVFDQEESIPYQLMHNGVKVIKDGYCAAWMTDLIYGLKGHHEPQEERVFHEVLKYIPPKAVMIELGSYWGYYSLWFAKKIAEPTNYLIEPDPERLTLGKKNFALNNLSASFFHGYVGTCGTDAGNFQTAQQIFIDSFLEDNNIEHVHILHSDIQGSEYEMLESAIRSIELGKIDYFFISTHSEKIHTDCINFLETYNYKIIAEHSPQASYSVDGLIAARRNSLSNPQKVEISKKHESEIDIISSFNINELPSKLSCIQNEFTINRTSPVDYLTKSADDPNLQKIIVFDPIFGGGAQILPTLPKEKLVLFVWEPSTLPSDIYDAYCRVYTWDDTLVDNIKFFRFNYPYLMPYKENPPPFEKKKLCAMVVGNWTSQRLKVLKFFEASHPEQLECYGSPPPGLQNLSMYKGHIPGLHSGEEKVSTLQNYRFCVCFENTIGLQGYITEKIFACFAAGCIPIYYGPSNIEQYIPKSCFIDYRDFKTDTELYHFISTMSLERHREYIEEIKEYLQSEQAQIFSPQFFENLLYTASRQSRS